MMAMSGQMLWNIDKAPLSPSSWNFNPVLSIIVLTIQRNLWSLRGQPMNTFIPLDLETDEN
jgi:hypothetical protein